MLARDDIAALEQLTKAVDKRPNNESPAVAEEERASGLLSASLRLFAPATSGKQVGGIAALICMFCPGLAELLNISTTHDDLVPPSALLDDLRRHTEEFRRKYSYPALFARIVYGKKEEVVQPGKLLNDVLYPSIPGRNHRSICKPNANYTFPLEFVSDAAESAAV
jgi:hypothetical protein